jgi:DNA repair protein RadC
MPSKTCPKTARPREKLLARGPGALSDAELLALLLRTGIPGKNVLQMGQELLDTAPVGGVAGLLHTTAERSGPHQGPGPGQARRAGGRAGARPPRAGQQLKERAVRHARGRARLPAAAFGPRPHEVFAVLFLDSQHRLIALEEMFRGTLTQTSVYPREVVQRALAPPCRQRGAGAQPPQRQRAAFARRRGADAQSEGRARAGRRARAGPRSW